MKAKNKKMSWNLTFRNGLISLIIMSTPLLMTNCVSSAETQASIPMSTSELSSAFPSRLAIASPFAVSNTANLSATLVRGLASPSAAYAATYEVATQSIDDILNGTSPASCTFDPEDFLTQETDASCYGPRVSYQEHPEGASGNSGELPPGDVGIWQESDATTGRPCGAEEFDARMMGISNKSQASLQGLASLVCAINTNGLSLPSSSILDLTAEMNALALSGVTFTNASIGHMIDADGNSQYTYNMRFEYVGADTYDMEIDMMHTPTSSASEYSGLISYTVSGANSFGGNCPDSSSTINASLQYARTATDAISVELRDGRYCGANANGRDANAIVDPSLKYPTTADGWSDDFNILRATYDPSTLNGNYSYVWQAGAGDGYTRTFNLLIEAGATSSTQNGLTFFGFGDDVATTDGSIEGFICNWAGPGNSHSIEEFSQYQTIEYDVAANTFAVTSSNIGYAPTTTCSYDGSGSFIYDTDSDGSLSDESHAAVSNDLLPGQDVNGDTVVSIEEVISDSGFVLPSL